MQIVTAVRDASRHGGGMLNVAYPLHEQLQRLGNNCAFISGKPLELRPETSHCVGVRGQNFPNLPAELMTSIVHIHGIWTMFEYRAFKEARRRGASILMSPHGALESWPFNHKRTKKRLAWWLYQKRTLQSADLIVVNSPQERQRLRELGLTRPIATIPNGVDLQGYPARASDDERERIVLFFSRIDRKKGLPDLIDAWCALDDRKGYRLHIHGYGEEAYIENIRRRIAAAGTGDIALLPPVFGPARWDVFARASVYILPSYSENFGITVAEALAAGLPVITTRATPWGDLANGDLGWIVDNDVPQLRDALQAAINLDPVRLSTMRDRARRYATQRFGWEAIAQKYAETYRWLCEPSMPMPPWIDQE